MTDIRIDLNPPLAWVTLNRADKRNAVTGAMWSEIAVISARLAAEREVRAVLLRGAGDEAFSAGADIAEMRANVADPAKLRALQDATQAGQEAWFDLPLPTIAVIRGACVGGGCGLAIASDLRLATPDAYFAITPARLGLTYSLNDTRRLVDLVGPACAKEILYTAGKFTAEQALAMGLVNRIVPPDQIDAAAETLALDIAANAPHSLRVAKRLINGIARGERLETPESIALFNDSFRTPEFLEGAAAFQQKRRPKF
jgi:enoyl-CoA hydratase/carnithine racemase